MFLAIFGLLLSTGLAAGVSATALDAPVEREEGEPMPEFQSLVRSYYILGEVIKGTDGEDLGRITQILLEPESGQATYVIVTAGSGVLGIAQDDRLVPWQALHIQPESYEVSMELTERQFKQAPKGTVISSRRQAEEIYRYYGVAPRWQQKGAPAGQPQQMAPGMNQKNGGRMQEQMRQQPQDRTER